MVGRYGTTRKFRREALDARYTSLLLRNESRQKNGNPSSPVGLFQS